MKAISIRQPYAWLIVNGHKKIENRSRATSYRGPLLIHAGLRLHDDTDYILAICDDLGIQLPDFVDCGGIVGVVDLVDVVYASDDPWFTGPWGYVLANPRPLPFRAMKGKLDIFDVKER